MNKYQLKNINSRVRKKYSRIRGLFNILCRSIREKINKGMDNDILPLVIAPLIFISFAALEWWSWYLDVSIPSPILIIIVATGLGALCYIYELLERKETADKKERIGVTADHKHPELH
ncbi:MAG: hypothetical protein K2P74_08635 [Nitrosomonas sp.]|nr:hypothetical protein [Nitrosomonas sp.]